MADFPDTNFDLSPLVGTTAVATQFGNTNLSFGQQGHTSGRMIFTPQGYSNENRWDVQTGPVWTEAKGLDQNGDPGPAGTARNYAITAVDNAAQVLTIAVTDAGGAPVATIYAQLIAYSADALFLGGFLTFDPASGALSNPLTSQGGTTDYFLYSPDGLSVYCVPVNRDYDAAPSDPDGLNAPLGLALLAAPCLAAGTLIATPGGPVAVEHLAAGDSVLDAAGASHAIHWVGSAVARCGQARQPQRICPVHVQAGAFGNHLPSRSLVLSPEHAVLHDGVLVPIARLVNGATIQQRQAASVTYYHVALARHGVILAEGLPVESYLETGAMFGRTRPARAAA